jgi:C-terminal processing protease CtpA/Prc
MNPMRRTNHWRWAGLLFATLMIAGVAGLGRTAAAQDERGAAWLGVMTQTLTDELKESMEIEGRGVLVARVVDGSPADHAGIQRGDVIASVNSRGVTSPEELSRIVRAGRVGQEVSIEIVRDGRSRTVSATLEGRPGPESMESGRRMVIRSRDRDRDEMRDRDKDKDNDGDNDNNNDNDNDNDNDNGHDHDMDRDHTFNMPMPDMDHLPMVMGRGRLGVRVEDIGPGDRGRNRVSRGAVVNDVVDGSAAEKAGLRAGDIITRVDDQTIDDSADLVRTMRSADRHVRITFVRNGSSRTVEADLDDAPQVYRYRIDRNAIPSWTDKDKGEDGDRRVTIQRDLDGMNADQLRREVRELRRQVEELRKQLDEQRR